ncbi:MAG: oligosaccharide flippase family protein [Candidatus Limnocylindria bacterium]
MILLRSAARNISIVAASHLLMWLATMAFTVAQARYLEPALFGQLSLALSYGVFLSIVIDFGLGAQLSRMVAQRSGGHGEAVVGTIVIRGALWLAALPVLWLVTILLDYEPALQKAILVLAVSVLFAGIGGTVGAYLQGREEFLLPSLAGIAQRFTAATIGVLILMSRPELGAVAGAFVIAAVVNVVVLLAGLRARLRIPQRIDPGTAVTLLRSGTVLGAYWVLANFYFNFDMVMLQKLAAAENVGWYAAAYRLFNAATIVPVIVAGIVLYPILARLSLGPRAELAAVIEKALTLLTLTGVAAALLLAVNADGIVAFLYPYEEYAPAAGALRLLAPGLLFLYVNSVLTYAFFALHRERRLLLMAGAFALLNPLANLLAIPLLRQEGAAVVTSLTELGLLVWLLISMPRDLLNAESLRVAAKASLAAVTAALVVGLIGPQALYVSMPLALVVYVAICLCLRTVAPGDLDAIVAVFGRPRRPAALRPIAQPIHEEVT